MDDILNYVMNTGRWSPIAQVNSVLGMNKPQAQDYRNIVDKTVPTVPVRPLPAVLPTPKQGSVYGDAMNLGAAAQPALNGLASNIVNAIPNSIGSAAKLPAARNPWEVVGDVASIGAGALQGASLLDSGLGMVNQFGKNPDWLTNQSGGVKLGAQSQKYNNFRNNPSVDNIVADTRGSSQIQIEEAIKRGDLVNAKKLANTIKDKDTREGMLGLIKLVGGKQTVPYTETAPGVFHQIESVLEPPIKAIRPGVYKNPNMAAAGAAMAGMELPQWVIDAINGIPPIATNADRQAHLGYSTAVQGVGNLLGFPSLTNEQKKQHPFLWNGQTVPPLRRDIAGEQERDAMRNDLSLMASAYLGQVPIGNFDENAHIQRRQWNAQTNNAVLPGKEASSGYGQGAPYPFTTAFFSRANPPAKRPNDDPIDVQNDVNNDGYENDAPDPNDMDSSPDGADSGMSRLVNSLVDEAMAASSDDPSQTAIPMSIRQKNALRVALYRVLQKASGTFDSQGFNQDLGTYIDQNPQILNDISFVNQPFYSGQTDEQKLHAMYGRLGSKYGLELKSTPIGKYYEGILK